MQPDAPQEKAGEDTSQPDDGQTDEALSENGAETAATADTLQAEDEHDAELLGEMPVFSRDTPEELLQWLTLSLNQLRRRSGRLGQNVSIVDKLLSSLKGLRLVGYGMSALVILDVVSLLLGAQIMNPGWEWTFFGATVERSAVLLLGVALVFLGHENLRGNLERYFLQVVYWGALGAGLAYLLMLPLGVANSFRLQTFYQQQYESQYNSVESQYQQILAQINATQPPVPQSATSEQEAQRKAATARAAREANQLKQQAEQQLASNKALLRRQSLSWLAGGLLVGVIFLVLWQQARWVRSCKPKKVIRPWLRQTSRKISKQLGLNKKRKKHSSRARSAPSSVAATNIGPGAQPGIKPGIRSKRRRDKDK